MNITVDCRMINSSGIGVYLRGCLSYFFNSIHNFLLIGNHEQLYIYISDKIKIINCNTKPFSINEIFFFPAAILKEINKTDIYYSPFFNLPQGIKIPVYTTIHDIIFPDMPELFSKIGLSIRMYFLKRAYKISKKIFTVSQFSKSRIEQHLGLSKPVVVTYSAIQIMYINYRENNKNVIKNETIIFIGNIKKHKGLDCLLEAFLLAKNEGLPHKLFIIGSKNNLRTSDKSIIEKINSIGEDKIIFTGFLSDEELLNYLASSFLLVQPSLYEGFCLPPLEAMVLGTNVLISDIPVLKEIYSCYPVSFFRAGDSLDLKIKIMELIFNKKASSPELSDDLLSKYTFQKTTSIILKNIA